MNDKMTNDEIVKMTNMTYKWQNDNVTEIVELTNTIEMRKVIEMIE